MQNELPIIRGPPHQSNNFNQNQQQTNPQLATVHPDQQTSYIDFKKDQIFQEEHNPPGLSVFASQPEANQTISLEDAARRKFIRTVLTIVACQLLLTASICILSYSLDPIKKFQFNHFYLIYVALGTALIIALIMICTRLGKIFPWNMLLLSLFTCAEAYLVSTICSYVATTNGLNVVLIAAWMTVAIVVSLTILSLIIRIDERAVISILVVLIVALILFVIIGAVGWQSWAYTAYCGLGVLIMGIYIVFDIRFLIADPRYGMTLDDTAVGAMILYLDIVQLFLYLLGGLKRN